MYKMYFLKEKNAFTKEIFTLSIKVYEYILEYNANFCSYYVCIIFFYILNFFRPRGFSVREDFLSNICPQNRIFSGKMTSLSYKTNFFPTFIAILENPVEKFFLQSPKNWDFYFPSERLISVREVQMYKMYFLKEKNAFTKEIFTLSIKVYEYILEYNAIFAHIMFALYIFTF